MDYMSDAMSLQKELRSNDERGNTKNEEANIHGDDSGDPKSDPDLDSKKGKKSEKTEDLSRASWVETSGLYLVKSSTPTDAQLFI